MGKQDPLRAALESSIKRLEKESIEKQQDLAAEDIEKAERLGNLIAIRDRSLGSGKSLSRWPTAAVVAGTLLILSFLLFLEPRETEIELNAVTDELTFVLSEAQRLSGIQQLESIGVTGAEAVRIPPPRGGVPMEMSGSKSQTFKLQRHGLGDDRSAGTISFDDLGLLRGTRITFRAGGQPGKYSVDLDGDGLEIRFVVSGNLLLAMPPQRAELRDFGVVGKRLGAFGREISLDLELVSSEEYHTPAKQFEIKKLSLLKTDEYTVEGAAHVRKLSTIKSGKIYLEEVGGRVVNLRSGQRLLFDNSRGRIRDLTLRGDGIHMAFHGWVQGMRTGTIDSPRSLMPSWLEWIQSRQPAALLWAAVIYVSGLSLAVLRWLGVAK